MLEHRGVLITWELPTLAFDTLPATFEQLRIQRLADHRIAYLTYEGPVSSDRGTVTQVDSGAFWVTERDSNEWLEVEATGRTYYFKLELPKVFFGDFKGATEDVELHLMKHGKHFPSCGRLLEFSLRAPGSGPAKANLG